MTAQTVEVNLGWLNVFSLISTAFSLALAIIAIWLSIVFYRMSQESSTQIHQSSEQIKSSVERLENLFDKLYTDTFGIVKETVTDMRNYVYKENRNLNPKELEIDDKIKEEIGKAVEGLDKDNISRDELKDLVLHFVNEYKEEKGKRDNKELRNIVLSFLRKNEQVTFGKLKKFLTNLNVTKANDKNDSISAPLFITLEDLVEEGKIRDPFFVDQEGYKAIRHDTEIIYIT